MGWELPIDLSEGDGPVYVRIAEAVVSDIRRGRLAPGDALPGTRPLAKQLGVHRNTVIAAWRELIAQGWLVTRPGGETAVAPLPIEPEATGPGVRMAGYRIHPPVAPAVGPVWKPGTLELVGGKPDLRQLPLQEITRAWRSAIAHTRGRLLGYGDGRGHRRLREALAGMLAAERGLVVDADEIIVTRGSQQALNLLGRALLRPGDRVAVEVLGYPLAWAALRSTGATLVPIDVDDEGIRVDQLEDAAQEGLRAVYVTPHHQYPTTVTLSAARRLALLSLAAERRFAIIEDDYDPEFHFAGHPVLPLAARDDHGVVVYVGTLSKTLAPGLRLGFLSAPREVVHAVHAHRVIVDRQGDLAMEYALATLIENGTVPRHLRRMRRVYRARQAFFVEALREHLAEHVRFDVPAGGLALWVEHLHDDVDGWSRRAAAAGVGFETGRRMHLHGQPGPWFRAGFAALTEPDLERAVRILAETATP